MSATGLASKLRRGIKTRQSIQLTAEEVRFLCDGGFVRALGIGYPLAFLKPLPWPKSQVVYFVGADDPFAPVKIGYASNLRNRFNGLRYLSPQPLVILGYTEGSRDDEAQYHKRFAHIRLHGEWFRRSDDLVDHISHLRFQIRSRS